MRISASQKSSYTKKVVDLLLDNADAGTAIPGPYASYHR